MMTKIVIMMMAMMMATGGNVKKNIENRDETRVWINRNDVAIGMSADGDYKIGLVNTVHIDREGRGTTEVEARELMVIYGLIHNNDDIYKWSVCDELMVYHFLDGKREDYVAFYYRDKDDNDQLVKMTFDELDECAKYYTW